jgi:hypothetical protein
MLRSDYPQDADIKSIYRGFDKHAHKKPRKSRQGLIFHFVSAHCTWALSLKSVMLHCSIRLVESPDSQA